MNRENELNYFRTKILPKYVTKPVKQKQEEYLEELRENRKEREEYLNELSERYIECMFFENFSINLQR